MNFYHICKIYKNVLCDAQVDRLEKADAVRSEEEQKATDKPLVLSQLYLFDVSISFYIPNFPSIFQPKFTQIMVLSIDLFSTNRRTTTDDHSGSSRHPRSDVRWGSRHVPAAI